ncbi:MAG: TIGR03087 family PEP-CTERM/XrtA system glycosyltransferase [Novosphingobium sp.]
MSEILFIAHRIPFPPDRGDKIRSNHVLRAIAGLAPVHVACFADDAEDLGHEPQLAELAASHCLVRRSKPLPWAWIEALASASPVSLRAFHDRRIARYVRDVLASRPISAIYVFSGQMGQYVPASCGSRFVMDFVDVDSAKFDAYGQSARGPMRWIHAREGQALRQEEARLATRATCSLFISREEGDLFRSRLSRAEAGACDIRVLGNGIDSDGFAPENVEPEPRMLACVGPRLIFTGQMDYAPNVEAVRRVMDHILPLVRQTFPEASFHVAGRNPPAELRARDGRDGCHVWGRVDDIRTWLRAADCAIVPLAIARGVQNKVLEAMAMASPVVLSSVAATGIPAQDGQDFAIADRDVDLAAHIVALMRDRLQARRMGTAARHFVVERMSWPVALADLPEILGLAYGDARHAA